MRLVQFRDRDGARRVGVPDSDIIRIVNGFERVYDLARAAARSDGLEALVSTHLGDATENYGATVADNRVLAPIDHPDPAHCLVSGTGLSHLGSAQARDKMHAKLTSGENLTDSMKMFKAGLDGGKPAAGKIGADPEWFWKGDGSIVMPCGAALTSPSFALDGGEEAEVAGIYLIGDDSTPLRLGFALANEFADHVLERQNYLLLAHSKLRHCAVGPELRLGSLPASVEGTTRIRRANEIVWQGPFLSGENNMSHSVANLEHHHFKYTLFRRPGDIHIHFLGAGSISFADAVKTEEGDMFEIDVPEFGHPLSNSMTQEHGNAPVTVADI